MVVEKTKMEFFSKKCCLEIYIKQPRCYRNPGYSTYIDVMLLNSLIVSKANVFSRQAELVSYKDFGFYGKTFHGRTAKNHNLKVI